PRRSSDLRRPYRPSATESPARSWFLLYLVWQILGKFWVIAPELSNSQMFFCGHTVRPRQRCMFPRRHDTGVLQLERNGSTIWAISPRNTGSSLLRILGATARQQCFCGRQLTNRNRINPAWMVMCKMCVDLRVVLPVISHQRPGELREIFRKPSQCIDFMCHTRS